VTALRVVVVVAIALLAPALIGAALAGPQGKDHAQSTQIHVLHG
jgi:hypothetical protein